MKNLSFSKRLKETWNKNVIIQLRRIGILKRLTLSFSLLLISIALMTFFSYYQYNKEINQNLNRYASLLVQNVEMKISDTMKTYEDILLRFYNDNAILQALSENAALLPDDSEAALARYEQNSFLIESGLYSLGQNRKHIVNAQLVTPDRQYHMAEASGYLRGGTIRDLDSFYKSDFYLLPQQKRGYPVWMDSSSQTTTFYKNNQSLYGLANIITLGVAIYDPSSREFLGVLLLNISLNAFSDSVYGYGSYHDGNFFLLGQDGLLTWFNPTLQAPSLPRDRSLYTEMAQHDSSIVRTRSEGKNVLMAYERVSTTPVFVVYLADLSILLARTYQTRNLCILVLICISFACVVLSNSVSVSISAPICQLVNIMQKTGDKKWEARYENSGHDEITILGDRFNEMLDKINQLVNEVYLSEIRRQKSLLNQKNAQLNALLMQINPHFLYNTLDIIRWEAMYEAHGESNVTHMIEQFSRLCRMSIQTNSSTIPLAKGLEHASTYLDVINFRHSEKIRLALCTQVDADRFYIPPFLLQPLMENAVVHGFNGSGGQNLLIRIHSFLQDQKLHILLEDNGKGMSAKKLSQLQSSLENADADGESIGLTNIHQRIRLFYGDAFGVRVSSVPSAGTGVEIILPARNISENMEEIPYDIPGFDR